GVVGVLRELGYGKMGLIFQADPDDSVLLDRVVLLDPDPEMVRQIGTLGREDAATLLVVLPTVVGAAKCRPAFNDLAQRQRSPTMCAKVVEDTDLALEPRNDELLTAERDGHRIVANLVREGDRLPEVPERSVEPRLALYVEFVGAPRDVLLVLRERDRVDRHLLLLSSRRLSSPPPSDQTSGWAWIQPSAGHWYDL